MTDHTEPSHDIPPTTQSGDNGGSAVTNADVSVAALAALYQGEKTDASNIFNTAMAMMGIAVAYLIGAIPFVTSLSHGPMGWLFVLLLPMPLWLVVAFHSLITLNAMSHGISVRILENRLFVLSELTRLVKSEDEKLKSKGERLLRQWVGSAAGDRIMDITQASWIHGVITSVVYGGVFLLVAGFTLYALHSGNNVLNEAAAVASHQCLSIAASASYAFLFVMVLLSWGSGFLILREGGRIVPKEGGI
jgi:hypothetical protein